jgi:hypothetical protein
MRFQMTHRLSPGVPARVGLALVTFAAATVAFAGPVAAATPPTSDYGNTVECRYRAPGTGPAYDFLLKKFVVTPPKLFAKSSTQKVGWRFSVTRTLGWGTGPTKVTYTSPIQKASATTSHAAAFTSQSVDVQLPNIGDTPYQSVSYTVTLKLFWYNANGTVQSKTVYQMPYMKWILNGHYYGDWDNECQGGFYEGP